MKKCAKPVPGAAAGGCAFDGAQIVLVPIADAAHLVHGPATCAGLSWGNRGTLNRHGDFHRLGFSTDVSETDIIFGGEEKVTKMCERIAEDYNPSAIFVYLTCVTAMTGEDIDTWCDRVRRKTGIPVIPVNSPGFIGSKNLGNKLAGDALAKYVIGTKEPENPTPHDINIIGEYNIAGELWQVEPLFRELGINLAGRITGNARYEDIASAHRSRLSVVSCSRALLSLARRLEEDYGIPWLEGSFYGMGQTGRTLIQIAEMLGDADLIERTEQLIMRKEEEMSEKLRPYIEKLHGKKVMVYTGGVKSWSVIHQLEELGMEVIGTSTRKSTDGDIERIERAFEGTDKVLMPKGDGRKILALMEENGADLLLAGGRNMYTAMKARIPFVDVNQERIRAFAGYDGMLVLAECLVNTLESPVFDLARSEDPWKEGAK